MSGDDRRRTVAAHEAERVSEREKRVWRLAERSPVDQLTTNGGRRALANYGERNERCSKSNETHDTHRPGKANARLQLVEDDRIDDTA